MMADVPVRVPITGGTFAAPTPQPAFQSQSSFVQRVLEFVVTLAPDPTTSQPIKFAGTGSPTVRLSGHRAAVRIQNSGAPSSSQASVRIWGMGESLMNQLQTLGIVFNSIQRNSLRIEAGSSSGLSPVFEGDIYSAIANYNDSPNVPMCFECQTGLIHQIVSVPPSSFPQSTDVATIMAGFARQMSVGFENNGVTVQTPPVYLSGTLLDQVQALAEHAHINAVLIKGSKLAIWPIGGSRTSPGPVPLVSKDTGMIGYPSFASNGLLIVKTLFNPQISFGGTIRVESRITQANRSWVVQKLDLALDSLVPKGQWMATCECYPLGQAAPPPSGMRR